MSPDDKDNNQPGDKKPPMPKQVVVTHYGKKKKVGDVPPEIMPTEPTHIIGSPVEIGSSEQSFKGQPSTPAEKPSPAFQEPRAPQEPSIAPQKPISEPSFAQMGEQVSSSAYSAAPPVPNDFDNNKADASSGGGGGALFLSFITLVAVVVLSYYAYTNYQQLLALQAKTNDDQTSVLALTTQAQKTLEQLASWHDKNVSEQTALSNLKKNLESEQFKLASLSGNTDWMLAQANYLVFMANERLKTAHDVTTAVAQLRAADEQLSTLANPALLWIRDVLAKDIAKLKTFPSINRAETWERIGLLSNQFNYLHFKTLTNEMPQESNLPDETMSPWQKGLWRSWLELKSLIRITHIQENPIPNALTFQEREQILRTLQMMAEQARWAVLQGENKIYQNSLQTIKSWLSEYFLNDKAQLDLLAQIQELEQQNVNVAIPDISDSVQALSKAMIAVSNKEASPQRATQ